MGNSRHRGSLGLEPLQLDRDFVPPRTPGSLGRFDAGDPNAPSLMGNTPGPLGLGDFADPNAFQLRPPPDFYAVLDQENATTRAEFEALVLDEHIKLRSRKRKPALPIPDEELSTVEGDFKLRKLAAEKCRTLLMRARQDLKNEQLALQKKSKEEQAALTKKAKADGEILASSVRFIGITSAYRSPKYDLELWRRYFRQKYYPVTDKQRRAFGYWEGGRHGRKAVHHMVDFIKGRKAAPGFSNHSRGIAVDFFTMEDGLRLQAETGNNNKALKALNKRWEKSWLYRWLDKHKKDYKMDRIATEAWHWEFQDISADTPAAAKK